MASLQLLIFFTLLSLSSIAAQRPPNAKLHFVHLLYRHGDRSPGSAFPTDPCQEACWPQGWSQLTKIGMEQHFELGGFFRKRYVETDKFLNSSYLRDEIYVRATDKDRTLQSALCNLAGLYPPDSSQVFNSSLPWQPIPVHTIPDEDDFVLEMDNVAGCDQFNTVYHTQTDAKVAQINKDNDEFFKYLMSKTGLPNVTFLDIGDVYGPLFRENANGMGLPSWANEIWSPDNITVYQKVLNLEDQMKQVNYDTPEKAKFTGGPLLGEMIDRMQQKINKAPATKKKTPRLKTLKVYMYSAHDDTVLALLGALGVLNGRITPYAAAVIVELWTPENNDTQYNIDVLYRNDTSVPPFRLVPRGCSEPCSLDQFIKVTKSTTVKDGSKKEWDKICAAVPSSSTNAPNGTSPTIPTSNGTSPTIPTSNGTSPTIPSSNGTSPTIPSSNGTSPTMPSSNGTSPTVPSSNGTSPSIPTSTGTSPTIPTSNGTSPTIPTSKGTSPNGPTTSGASTCYSSMIMAVVLAISGYLCLLL